MDCLCHLNNPTQFPNGPTPGGLMSEAAFFAAVVCGCGAVAWRVSWHWACGPHGRVLICRHCGREEWVECPGLPPPRCPEGGARRHD